MAETLTPSEIARETLRMLAQRRLPPTPDNYQTVYREIAGIQGEEPFQDKALRTIAAALPRTTPEETKVVRPIEDAIAAKSWPALSAALNGLVTKASGSPLHWQGLIRSVIGQLDTRSQGITATKKREALEHVLKASSNQELVFQRIQSLLRTWSQAPVSADIDSGETFVREGTALTPSTVMATATPIESGFRDLCLHLLDNTVTSLLIDAPELAEEAKLVANDIRAAQNENHVAMVAAKLKKFSYRVNFVAEDQSEVRTALMKLLRLVIDNISELVLDDKWLHGQISVVTELIDQKPLNLRQLDNVESRLRDLIVKQSALKQNLTEAQDRLKAMLATFVDRLADFSESTQEYQEKIERCAERITQAESIGELSDVLDDVMRETRDIQINALRSHDDLFSLRLRADDAEREVSRLQSELAQASELVRHDPLTGVLNRKGMDESISREIARARRHGRPLAMAMVDIDNFKQLNDRLGHDAGDAALVHLAKIVRETIRPQDTLARYGGEEFVLLLPDTSLDDGATAMVRVQRELTRKFFLHGQEKILITFSCGVAEIDGEETPDDCLKRADSAMYLAKRSGKNRVVTA